MLRFALPNLGDWSPRHAHLIGPDDVAIPADISLTPPSGPSSVRGGGSGMSGGGGGIIEATKRIEGAAALAIQYPLPAPFGGMLALRTCLLPEREAPYLLTLELARHQVMTLLNKLEEWALFDRPANDEAMQKVHQAREAYTHALVVCGRACGPGAAGPAGRYPAEAESAAMDALVIALEAGEALALLSARVQHDRRISGELARLAAKPAPANAITDHEAKEARKRAAGSAGVILPEMPLVGCAVSPQLFGEPLCSALLRCADFVSVPMRWSEMEPNEGKYAFARTDRWIEWAVVKAKLPVVAGPVLEFEAGCVPDFLYIWEHDYETLRDVVIEHTKNIVTRYRRTVHTWTICSGLHVGSNFAISYEQAVDLTRVCVTIVRKLHPGAKIQIEIAQPWGEYTAEPGARAARSIPPAVYCELLKQVGIEFDAVGLKIQMGSPQPGRAARDLCSLSGLLDRYAEIDLPVAVSMLGAPSIPLAETGPDGPEAGSWRRPWTPDHQALWAARAMAICAGKPFVRSICWQDIADAPLPSMPAGGLLTTAGQPKPALAAVALLRESLRSRGPRLPGSE